MPKGRAEVENMEDNNSIGPSARQVFAKEVSNVEGTPLIGVASPPAAPMALSGLAGRNDDGPDFLRARNLLVRARYAVEKILAMAAKGNSTGYVEAMGVIEADLRQAEGALEKAEDQEKHRTLVDALDRIRGVRAQDRQQMRDSLRRAKDAIAISRARGKDVSAAGRLLQDAIDKAYKNDYVGAKLIADTIPREAS